MILLNSLGVTSISRYLHILPHVFNCPYRFTNKYSSSSI